MHSWVVLLHLLHLLNLLYLLRIHALHGTLWDPSHAICLHLLHSSLHHCLLMLLHCEVWVVLHLLLQELLLLGHLCLWCQVAHRVRIRYTTRHALPAHLARYSAHLGTWMLSTHTSGRDHPIRARLHAHHGASLSDMRLSRARHYRVAHLLHLRRIHGLSGCHGRMTMRCHAWMHRLRLVCCHHTHLANIANVLLSPLALFRGAAL